MMKANYSDDVAYKIFKTIYAIFGERFGVTIDFDVRRRDTGEIIIDKKNSA